MEAIDLSERIAVVTGAGSGVGRAVALRLAQAGAAVALVGRTESKLRDTAQAIETSNGRCLAVALDAARADEVERLRQTVRHAFGTTDILINNAGIHGEFASIQHSDPERWDETLRINTVGPYLMSRAFMGGMVERGWGRIVNVSSASAFGAPGGLNSAYPLSKVALNHFTRQLAAELADTGVTANAIHPGEVRTEMWEAIRDDSAARGPEAEGAMAWARMVEETGGDPPEKAADLILKLVGPGSEATNGKFLWIDDGIQEPKETWE
jgi:NAD(P)-dependent dehydrogenase (short-subunit alcohol dehydrogenase family)